MTQTAVRGITEIVLWVHSLPDALHFYRDVLCLPLISPPEMKAPLFLKAGEGDGVPAMIVLVPLPPGAPAFSAPHTLHHLALEVAPEAFDAEQSRLAGLGFAVRAGKHPIIPSRTMYVDDPLVSGLTPLTDKRGGARSPAASMVTKSS